MNAFENQRKNLDFAETETAMGPLKGLNDRSGCKRSSRSEEHRDWRFVLGMANWANSLPTAQKVLSLCASYWERVKYKATFPASMYCLLCPHKYYTTFYHTKTEAQTSATATNTRV